MPHSIAPEVVGELLTSVIAMGDETSNLAERRSAMIKTLARLIGADAGFWSWGRGWPESDTVTPLAVIDFGFSDEQRACVIAWGLDRDAELSFRSRIVPRVRLNSRATSLREDVFTNQEWNEMPFMRQQLIKGGYGSWLHSVRYSASDTWSCMFLLRNSGKPDFGQHEAGLVDFAFTNVTWLHSTAAEILPSEAFAGLKPRQRTVMLMLLDGLSRKKIASLLGIVEDTVGDHVKAIYSHFAVGSVAELAALFLRGK